MLWKERIALPSDAPERQLSEKQAIVSMTAMGREAAVSRSRNERPLRARGSLKRVPAVLRFADTEDGTL